MLKTQRLVGASARVTGAKRRLSRALPGALLQHGGRAVYATDRDADASPQDIEALVAQSQKRSAVYDILVNPTDVAVTVNAG